MSDTRQYEKAAAEYLIAFIKHLFNEGKSGFEIAETLEINSDLIEKLISDRQMLDEMEKRNEEFVEQIKANYPDENELKNKLYKHHLYFGEYDKKYHDYSDRLKNIGPWQRRFGFKNAIDFYFTHKKRYSKNDIDVLTSLSTETTVEEPKDNFADRELTPAYKLRIINDISDGLAIIEISEKYNCSELAVKQAAEEQHLTLPVTKASIRERCIRAIKDGCSLEQLAKRFKILAHDDIKELIRIHRILPVMEKINS